MMDLQYYPFFQAHLVYGARMINGPNAVTVGAAHELLRYNLLCPFRHMQGRELLVRAGEKFAEDQFLNRGVRADYPTTGLSLQSHNFFFFFLKLSYLILQP